MNIGDVVVCKGCGIYEFFSILVINEKSVLLEELKSVCLIEWSPQSPFLLEHSHKKIIGIKYVKVLKKSVANFKSCTVSKVNFDLKYKLYDNNHIYMIYFDIKQDSFKYIDYSDSSNEVVNGNDVVSGNYFFRANDVVSNDTSDDSFLTLVI